MTPVRPLPLLWLVSALALAPTAQAARTAYTGATVHTLAAAGTLKNATLIVHDERIEALGVGLPLPADTKQVDATGLVITPGLFDAHTHLGLEEISGVDQTRDDTSKNPRYSAALDAADGLNPRSSLIAIQRAEGITHALSAPSAGSGALLAGRGAVIALGARVFEQFLLKPRAAQFADYGEAGAASAQGGRPVALLALREALEEARRSGFSSPVQRPALLGALDAEALKPVLDGEQPLVVRAHRAADIRALLALGSQYGLKLVIRGGAEAHLLAPALAQSGTPVILDPGFNLPSRFETLAARLDAAARLQQAGVLIAFSHESDQGSHNSRNIRQLAGIAAANGLPWNAALAAITLNPARIYGLDSTLGSLEVGKSATFVAWDGDPLEVTQFAKFVVADGRPVPADHRQRELLRRYLKR